ncbi:MULTISPECIES: hypothetical protein [unclassified Streptomyces]|uniref:hypothetical protein n=1 Tax=unclassified Streptomyces TaxID=2593676 RepID=UPI00136D8B11|nr:MULTISPECIES: hypothetical protein [unclassified Streptomyces]NDZ98486.1 hypothetical protein [Streptomyces sp. SID10116]MYY79787.1 hypothetical protein [Streptomyces sp. SID335]MYZ16509.1 hypothetical protein [Streptomyces sp. SID337]NDZ84476.1 hypothetical protein [Streptomyces sp. SID10115]NEB43439.1 hypothetical protein [Streptomyces sp. SID339]
MPFTAPTVEDLGLYLDLAEIDGNRADLLLRMATSLCQTVVKPLPEGADAVVLSVAGRAYTNPQQVSYETIGPMSVQRPTGSGGLYLTKADKSALKSLAGRGGAFTVDPTPGTADPSPTWPVDDAGFADEFEPGWGYF